MNRLVANLTRLVRLLLSCSGAVGIFCTLLLRTLVLTAGSSTFRTASDNPLSNVASDMCTDWSLSACDLAVEVG